MNDSEYATIACWQCGAKMSVTADQMGDSVECPACQAQTTVPPEAFGLPPAAKTVESGTAAPSPQVSPESELNGLGGWLVLPSIGLIFGLVLGMAGFLGTLYVGPEVPRRYQDPLLVALCMDVAVYLFLIYTAVRFFGRRKNAPRTYILLFIIAILVSGASTGIGLFWGFDYMIFGYGFSLLLHILGASILIPYLSASRRVKNTFVIP